MMCCHISSRREFIGRLSATALLAPLTEWREDLWDPDRPFLNAGRPLRVQPILMYRTPARRKQTSWRSWGGIQTEQAAAEEVKRITDELKSVSAQAEFPMELLPVVKVTTPESAPRNSAADVTVIYPATGAGTTLRSLIPADGYAVIFVRHRSGPVYYWYEALSTRYLVPPLSVNDVVVDDTSELLWRLRAFYAAKNFLGTKILALGGARGKYAAEAPRVARERFKWDIVEVTYADFEKRIRGTLNDRTRMSLAERWTERYLRIPGTRLETDRQFVVNAFALYGLFKEMMQEHGATAFTIGECMGTIMPMSQTTACLTLQLMNDEGLPAFCESDFVIVPAGMLLRHVAGRPAFLHNSTFPHKGLVTCAHCTGPRRMNGTRYEPARLLTHYESDYGVAPKVEIPPGQEVTFIDPEYATCRWVGMRGTVEGNPSLDICRSQQDVRIHGDWKRLLDEVRDSHWVMAYGNLLKEIGHAAPHIGVTWDPISEA